MSIEWNGDGMPPEGCECELYDCERWIEVKIKYIGDHVVVVHEFSSSLPERVFHLAKHPDRFRPIRTEEERKRDEAVDAFCDELEVARDCGARDNLAKIYRAIATGKIPHITLK